jgi:hypothetical protein
VLSAKVWCCVRCYANKQGLGAGCRVLSKDKVRVPNR